MSPPCQSDTHGTAAGCLGRRVHYSLHALGRSQLTAIHCEDDGSTVTLRGEVPSEYLTQVAQAIAGKVPGVRRVINQIEVCCATRPSQ